MASPLTPGTELCRHFKLWEFAEHTGRLPPQESVAGLIALCHHALEPLRAEFGPVRIISGYRSHAYNDRIGGAPRSHHVYDWWPASPAADVVCASGQEAGWYHLLDGLRVGGLGLYPGHVHVDLRSGRARW